MVSAQRIRPSQNGTSSLGLTIGWNPCQQAFKMEIGPIWYHEHVNTLGLWYHVSQLSSFTLAVNDFGVKYVDKADVNHLIDSIKKDVYTHQRLGGRPVLQCSSRLGLQKQDG